MAPKIQSDTTDLDVAAFYPNVVNRYTTSLSAMLGAYQSGADANVIQARF